MPLASSILMIRPAAFGFNRETAADNFFQEQTGLQQTEIQQQALAEFDNMVQVLQKNGIEVHVLKDTVTPVKPDAVFPNNWFNSSPSGVIGVFPMYAPNRRAEKREELLQEIEATYQVTAVQDWSEYEAEGRFLEGTGSMIIDYDNQLIYAAISARTNLAVLEKFATANDFQAVVFLATDEKGQPIYHTNVAMALGEGFAVLCEEAIEEEWEQIAVRQLLESTNHEIIRISRKQVRAFAGNMLALKNQTGEIILVLSQTAYASLEKEQLNRLEQHARLLPIPIPTIEQVSGGSVRCMMAEIFLAKK